jgi:hypothetical protein
MAAKTSRLIRQASMAIALVGVAACSGTGGQPEPATTGSAPTSSDPGTGPTSQASGDITDANACSLLTSSEATTVGLPATGSSDDNGAKSGCIWNGSDCRLPRAWDHLSARLP